jgi:hypothetical protein
MAIGDITARQKGNSAQLGLQSQTRRQGNFEKYKARIVVKGFPKSAILKKPSHQWSVLNQSGLSLQSRQQTTFTSFTLTSCMAKAM